MKKNYKKVAPKGELHRALEHRVVSNTFAHDIRVRRPWQWIGPVLAGSILTVGIFALVMITPKQQLVLLAQRMLPAVSSQAPAEQQESAVPPLRRAIDGLAVATQAQQQPRLAAVSIDNMIEGRPPSGLNHALWVFEFPAEATITRFLAVFNLDDHVAEIGPVRSVRPYMIDLARSVHAALIHSGGSPDALNILSSPKSPVVDVNEFAFAPFFWRDRSRSGPHNLYTSLDQLRRIPSLSLPSANILESLTWVDGDPRANAQDPSRLLTIGYPEPYTSRWRTSPTGVLERMNADGTVQKNRDGSEIQTTSVVVQFADTRVLDAIGRRAITLTGTGDAMLVTSEGMELAQWKQLRADDRTQLVDVEGKTVSIPAGRVWWTVVPKGTSVSFE